MNRGNVELRSGNVVFVVQLCPQIKRTFVVFLRFVIYFQAEIKISDAVERVCLASLVANRFLNVHSVGQIRQCLGIFMHSHIRVADVVAQCGNGFFVIARLVLHFCQLVLAERVVVFSHLHIHVADVFIARRHSLAVSQHLLQFQRLVVIDYRRIVAAQILIYRTNIVENRGGLLVSFAGFQGFAHIHQR